MARFAYLANGDIVQFVNSYQGEKITALPANTQPYQFDEETNGSLVSDYNANSEQYRLDGGTLTKDSGAGPVPVTISPPAFLYALFLDKAEILAQAAGKSTPPSTAVMWDTIGALFRVAGL
jgi:hypothetical protein